MANEHIDGEVKGAPEYAITVHKGRLRITQGERVVIKSMSAGYLKLADDMTDEERKTFKWAVDLHDGVERIATELQQAKVSSAYLQDRLDAVRAVMTDG